MIPPRGFETEKYPLRHRLPFSFELGLGNGNKNTAMCQLIHSSSEMDVAASTIQTNPHNTNYEEDGGPLVRQMSIIDRMTISLKFAMTNDCNKLNETASGVFTGSDLPLFSFLWRPIFFSFGEKLDAADDDTTITVAALLGLTKDDTFSDVVPITTNKLPAGGPGELIQPVSTVNAVQVFGDFNMTTNTAMEDHVHDEDQLQAAMRRFTNKGALKACMGRTRHVTLTRSRPYKNFYLDKFVPRAVRRVVPFTSMFIQVHLPLATEVGQQYISSQSVSTTLGQLGCKITANYHEWNVEHDFNRSA